MLQRSDKSVSSGIFRTVWRLDALRSTISECRSQIWIWIWIAANLVPGELSGRDIWQWCTDVLDDSGRGREAGEWCWIENLRAWW